MKLIRTRYDKDEHTLYIELFEEFIVTVSHGVPGDWLFYHNEEEFLIYEMFALKYVSRESFRAIALTVPALTLRFCWLKGDG